MRIVAAAIQNGGKVYTGKRHALIMQEIWSEEMAADREFSRITQEQQGFVDEAGAFYGREQAARLAFHNGQISSPKSTLFSEDLW